MSVITVQIGQCGNQVGYDWYSLLGRESRFPHVSEVPGKINTYLKQTLERWFFPASDDNFLARSVLIDSEQKVINDICKKAASTQIWNYNTESVVCRSDGGSGNNWALGYNLRASQMQDEVLNCVRKEVEKCDWLSIFHFILSGAGGTGSGLGSRIISHLHDEYPSKCIISSVVFPYEEGEIVTQNYNLILTLSKIYNVTDMQIIFQNDVLHRSLANLYGNTPIQFQHLNYLIAEKLSSLFQPISDNSRNYLPTFVSHLTPHPCFKMVSISSAPHCSNQGSLHDTHGGWDSLSKRVLHSLKAFTYKDELSSSETKERKLSSLKYERCIANLLITRGNGNLTNKDYGDLQLSELYPDWIPVESRFHHFHQPEKLLEFNKFMSLTSNNSSMYKILDKVLQKAWTQFSQKAYLHQYTKYNMEEEDIAGAFVKLEDIVKNYKDLTV